MKIPVFVGVLLVSGCLAFSMLAFQKASERPWHFVNPVITLDNMTNEQAAPVTFEIKNESDHPLKIVSTDEGCRCTNLLSAPSEIAAHDVGIFRWVFSAARSKGLVENMVAVQGADGVTITGTFRVFVQQAQHVSQSPHI